MLPKRPGERWAVLQRLELSLAVGVVVGHVRAAVAAGDAEVDEELGDGLGGHRRAPIRMHGELVPVDAVGGERVGDERLSELAGLGRRHHPAHDVAAEDIISAAARDS
jgi:hypothetical protein